jgi:hypothetical protein
VVCAAVVTIPDLSLWIKFRYSAKKSRLNAKKLAILRTRLFINTGLIGFQILDDWFLGTKINPVFAWCKP